MMIEHKTSYAYKLKYLENPTFDKVRGFAKNFIDDLPKELVNDLYSQLDRGVIQIDSEPQMMVYLYSFGNMHQAKLNKAFEYITEFLFEQPEINIIDYGCGQAIGTMCYVDFIRQKGITHKVKRVILIEPSDDCLKRAALHVSIFCPNAEIVTVNKTFDNLDANDIVCDEEIPTLHILSNVLDLEFELERFAELISEKLKGYNQFVCVGPYFNVPTTDQLMEDFAELFTESENNYSKIFSKYELNPNKSWTAHIKCFTVCELKKKFTSILLEYRHCPFFNRQRYNDATNDNMVDIINVGCDFARAMMFEYAVSCWQYVINCGSDNPEALLNLGVSYYYGNGVKQDYKKAVSFYSRAAEKKHPIGIYNLAVAFENGNGIQRNIDKAIELYHEAANLGVAMAIEALNRLKINNTNMAQNLDFFYGDRSREDLFNDYITKAHRLEKEAYCMLQHKSQGIDLVYFDPLSENDVYDPFDETVEMYKKALELYPNAATFYNLANLYKDFGYYDIAIEHYQKASNLAPNDNEIYCNMGYCYYQKEDDNMALKCFLRAVGVNPNDTVSWRNAGNCYLNLGKKKLAEECYYRADNNGLPF